MWESTDARSFSPTRTASAWTLTNLSKNFLLSGRKVTLHRVDARVLVRCDPGCGAQLVGCWAISSDGLSQAATSWRLDRFLLSDPSAILDCELGARSPSDQILVEQQHRPLQFECTALIDLPESPKLDELAS